MNATQQQTDEATARPWYWEHAHSQTIAIYTASRTVGAHVASLPKPSHENGCTPREQAANAALIVRAVNAHDELVAALELAIADELGGPNWKKIAIALLAKIEAC